jgi:hypothetical protein
MTSPLYHVTERRHIDSIRKLGLLADPPERRYQTSKLYFTDAEGIWPWSRELASKSRQPLDIVVLAVDGCVGAVGARPFEGMSQWATRRNVEAERLHVVGELLAIPDLRPIYMHEGDPCPGCKEPVGRDYWSTMLLCEQDECEARGLHSERDYALAERWALERPALDLSTPLALTIWREGHFASTVLAQAAVIAHLAGGDLTLGS